MLFEDIKTWRNAKQIQDESVVDHCTMRNAGKYEAMMAGQISRQRLDLAEGLFLNPAVPIITILEFTVMDNQELGVFAPIRLLGLYRKADWACPQLKLTLRTRSQPR
jgi:hypothetical protein